MRLHRLLCIPLLLLTSAIVQADCACLWQGSFSEVQGATSLVVSGVVIRGKGNSVDLSVDRLLRGQEHLEEIRIWLKTGDQCRPEPELFPTGSEWVMALHRIETSVPGGFNPNTPNISYGRLGDYSLSSCGGYWLRLNDDRVTGNLIDAPRWEHDPKMTPVLLDLVADFIDGNVDADVLLEASKENPAVRELMLDTREFLRQQKQVNPEPVDGL